MVGTSRVEKFVKQEKSVNLTDDFVKVMAKAIFDEVMQEVRTKVLAAVREEVAVLIKSMPAPQVVIPEAAIKLHVQQRSVTKSIEYDEYSRPARITEKESE